MMSDEEMKEAEEAEAEGFEIDKWKNRMSKDDYETWKLKKYIDERVMRIYIIQISLAVGIILYTWLLS